MTKWSERQPTQTENFAYFVANQNTSFAQFVNADEANVDNQNKFLSFAQIISNVSLKTGNFAQFSVPFANIDGVLTEGQMRFDPSINEFIIGDSQANLALTEGVLPSITGVENSIQKFQLQASSNGGSLSLRDNLGVNQVILSTTNITRFDVPQFTFFKIANNALGGDEFIEIGRATTPPTANPNNAALLWVDNVAGSNTETIWFRTADGIIDNLSNLAGNSLPALPEGSIAVYDSNQEIVSIPEFQWNDTNKRIELNNGGSVELAGTGDVFNMISIGGETVGFDLSGATGYVSITSTTDLLISDELRVNNNNIDLRGYLKLQVEPDPTPLTNFAQVFAKDTNGAGTGGFFVLNENGRLINLTELDDRLIPILTPESIAVADSNGLLQQGNVSATVSSLSVKGSFDEGIKLEYFPANQNRMMISQTLPSGNGRPALDIDQETFTYISNFQNGNLIFRQANGSDIEIGGEDWTTDNIFYIEALANRFLNVLQNGNIQLLPFSTGRVQIQDGANLLELYQQGAISDASGGTVIDVEARSALNALLQVFRNNGQIAT